MPAESAGRVAFGILCGCASLAAGGGFATHAPCAFASLGSVVQVVFRLSSVAEVACRLSSVVEVGFRLWLGLSVGFLLWLGLSVGFVGGWGCRSAFRSG